MTCRTNARSPDAVAKLRAEKKALSNSATAAREAWVNQLLQDRAARTVIQKLEELISRTIAGEFDAEQFLQKLGFMWALVASPNDVRWYAITLIDEMSGAIRKKNGRDPLDDPIPDFKTGEPSTVLWQSKKILEIR